jgi:hypothetical protein
LKKQIPAGDNIGFRARLENPPGTARRLEVTFTEPAEDEMKPDDKQGS